MRYILFLILFIACFLRFYHFGERLEFLGDQGRDGIVIYEAWKNKELPLIGPPVSTGGYLGPFYYYLIAPFYILSNFNPLIPAYAIAAFDIMAIVLLFTILQRRFGYYAAVPAAALYATSPAIVSSTAQLWNPAPVPFFVLSLAYAFHRYTGDKNNSWIALMGLIIGIMVQLHYSALYYLLGIPLFLIVSGYRMTEKKKPASVIRLLVIFTGAVIFPLIPFFLYEIAHGFPNTQSLITLFTSLANGGSGSERAGIVDALSSVGFLLLPVQSKFITAMVSLILIVMLAAKRKAVNIIIAAWLTSGVILLATLHDSIPTHYTLFLLPVPFIAAAAVLSDILRTNRHRLAAGIFVTGLVLFTISRSDAFGEHHNDLKRTDALVKTMIVEAGGEPFSFTVFNSRSFSDLHYRFFFTRKQVSPVPIENNDYPLLFVACEHGCPPDEEMKGWGGMQALCFDPVCFRDYPRIHLSDRHFNGSRQIENSRLFIFSAVPGS